METFGVEDIKMERQRVDFAKRTEMAVVSILY